MKYKLSEKLEKTLKDIVKPEHYNDVEERFLDTVSPHCRRYGVYIYPYETKFGCEFTLHCELEDFVEVEVLKPYVWYDREKFDGNPNNYLLLELTDNTYHLSGFVNSKLYTITTHFMYIERI